MMIRIRRACRADIAGMHRVRMSVRENQLVSTALTEADYVEHLESSGRGWVAEESGQIVGLVLVNARTGNIWGLFVHPDFEKRGLGRLLLDTAVGWLWDQGLTRLWLTTAPGTRAQRFYDAAGWSSAGVTEQGELLLELAQPPLPAEESPADE
jgi:GNAT superfamily N-acetyltransferase